MLQLSGSMQRGLGFALLLAGASCSAPDSSGLFGPNPPIRGEAQSADASAGEAAGDDGAGGEASTVMPAGPAPALPNVSNGEGPVPGNLSPPESTSPAGSGQPVALPADAGVALIDPATDAGNSAPEPPTPEPPTPEPPTPEPPTPEPPTPEPPAPEPPAPSEPTCGGVTAAGSCWYVGDLAQSCDAVCATRGGFDPSAAAVVGTPAQGGSIDGCDTVLQALGAPAGVVNEGFREDGLGFGCHVFIDTEGTASAWWLTAPDLSPSVADPNVRLLCGCVR